MFETLPIETLQSYWWIIISLLGSLLVFLMFVQGGQTLLYTLGKNETERKILVNALGRKWEFTFTTLVTFGGAFFAAFPVFYATSFGGAYWVWMAILFPFIIQAVAYEFRSKPNNLFGHRTYEVFLFINGALGTILIGTAVATFFTGTEFSIERGNITNVFDPVIASWNGAARGLEAVLDWRNVVLGLAVFFLARTLGILYFLNSLDHEDIRRRAKKQLIINSIPFVVLFLVFLTDLLLHPGYAVDPASGFIQYTSIKYRMNLFEMPLVLLMLSAGVVFVVLGILLPILSFEKSSSKGIWYAGLGTILTVLSLFFLAGFNHTAYYPSKTDIQSSLTIYNSSSSHYTLTVMSYVSLSIPIVVAYIWYSWRSMNRKKITEAEIESESHSY